MVKRIFGIVSIILGVISLSLAYSLTRCFGQCSDYPIFLALAIGIIFLVAGIFLLIKSSKSEK